MHSFTSRAAWVYLSFLLSLLILVFLSRLSMHIDLCLLLSFMS